MFDFQEWHTKKSLKDLFAKNNLDVYPEKFYENLVNFLTFDRYVKPIKEINKNIKTMTIEEARDFYNIPKNEKVATYIVNYSALFYNDREKVIFWEF